jgi:phosphatidylinositol alpha 1,6-mannosyltransferase
VHGRAARTLAPSRATADELIAHGVPRVWLWGRGVDGTLFDPRHRSGAVRRVLAPGGELLVGYVGRLAPEKRVELLAQTALLPGVKVVVVGDGPAAPMLRKAMPRAVFVGARHGQQLARLYASLDVFVHTGQYETFGQTIQEALASGVPVVAPAAGGPLDLITPGVNGTLVEKGSGSAIAAAVANLAARPDVREAWAAAARPSVEARTWPAIVDELIGHYSDVTGTPARPQVPRPRRALASAPMAGSERKSSAWFTARWWRRGARRPPRTPLVPCTTGTVAHRG